MISKWMCFCYMRLHFYLRQFIRKRECCDRFCFKWVCTPEDLRLEPENTAPLEEEDHLPRPIIFRFHRLIFGGLNVKGSFQWHPFFIFFSVQSSEVPLQNHTWVDTQRWDLRAYPMTSSWKTCNMYQNQTSTTEADRPTPQMPPFPSYITIDFLYLEVLLFSYPIRGAWYPGPQGSQGWDTTVETQHCDK